MHWIDWAIVAGMLVGMGVIAWSTHRLTRSVADFLAANRSAGRYLLTMASGMAGLGAISIAANFEKYYEAGFAGLWWAQLLMPIGLILALSGFVVYRYRETRAMTMAQFFEMRYSRRFRIFAGFLAWFSGILNYGIFPAVTARFLIYFTGLPTQIEFAGVSVPTLAPMMAVMLSLALTLTLSGGQIAVMITDFFQGVFVNITMLVILAVLASQISWGELIEGLQVAPPKQSKINPFDQEALPNFGPIFFFIIAFTQVYGFKAWQGSQGYNASATTPHEARMAQILGEFRGTIFTLLSLMLPVAMYAMLHLPQFGAEQQAVADTLTQIGDRQLEAQMRVPVALSQVLPLGVMGMFAAVVVAAAVSTDDTYLHSWGSIFIQDVVMPLRKRPLTPRQHIWLLRVSVVSVAIFAFIWSLAFPLAEYIFMYFAITGAIFLGGAGAVILGGLYWKRGTVEGAWAAMITGSTLAVGGIVLRNVLWPRYVAQVREAYADQPLLASLPDVFPLNGVEMSFFTALASVLMYVLFSLLSRRPPANMDKLLHRGAYAVETAGHHPTQRDSAAGPIPDPDAAPTRRERLWLRLGVGKDFTAVDKGIYVFKIVWTTFFFGAFVLGTAVALTFGISDEAWIKWWAFKVGTTAVIAVIAVVWFLVGGVKDLVVMIRLLRSTQRDEADDGSVPQREHVQE